MTTNHQNIKTLLGLCLENNQLAQLEVYNRYQHAMYNTAFRIVKNEAEAEDIMQEAFITAFEKLNALQEFSTFGSWLKRIVVNKSINQYHKNKKFVYVDLETLEEEEEEEDTKVDFKTNQGLNSSKVLDYMNKLHPKYQQILTLYYIEGFDYEEISKLFNCSYQNCRTLMSRAKKSLKKIIEKK